MDYTFQTDKYYIITDLLQAGELQAGLHIATTHPINFYDDKAEWEAKCKELGIEIEEDDLTRYE
jgi:hypothetical protein